MAYGEKDVQELSRRGRKWNPLQLLTPAVNRLVTNVRRPHGYGTDKEDFAGGGGLMGMLKAFAKNKPTYNTEDNWSNRWGRGLFEKSFGGELEEGSGWKEDEEGNLVINPEAKGARTMQARLNDAFLRSSTKGETGWGQDPENYVGGKKYKHPDLGGGEDYYKGKVDVLGDVYFDEEGNYVDYYNYDLDEGEKLKGKANWMRKVLSPFSTPPTVTGRAEKIPFSTKEGEEDVGWGDVLSFAGGGGDEDTSGPSLDQPVDDAGGKGGGLLKKLFGGKGFQGSGGGTGVLTGPRMTKDYADSAKGPFYGKSSPISRKSPVEQTIDKEGGGGKLMETLKGLFGGEGFQGTGGGKGYGEDAGPLYKAPEEEEGIPGIGGPINRKGLVKALGLGDEEDEEEFEAEIMDKMKGLGYRGSAKQNMALMERMGGKGLSIVDFLKGSGEDSSFGARRKLWEQFG